MKMMQHFKMVEKYYVLYQILSINKHLKFNSFLLWQACTVGFCVRIRFRPRMIFTSLKGSESPVELGQGILGWKLKVHSVSVNRTPVIRTQSIPRYPHSPDTGNEVYEIRYPDSPLSD